MEWEGREESENVEDRRGLSAKTGLAIGGAGTVVVVILAMLLGVDPRQLVNVGGGANPQAEPGEQRPARPADPAEEKLAHFAKVIFHDTEVVWGDLFQKMGRRYQKPVLVLFTDQVKSACGLAESAVGPFYCPGDSRVYIDLGFYQELEQKLQAPGEFARAYVLAHEVGHHVQRLLGYSDQVDSARRTKSKKEYNRMSVRLELQADFLAGVWAHHGQERWHFLDAGDLESALNAAKQIGDDRLQKMARGYVMPDSFTHGTSQQRMRWFQEGFKTGDVSRAQLLFDLPYEEL
jgi:predicted metalloprotease